MINNNKISQKKILDNKIVLITGGTGSFGEAFVKNTLDNYNPKKLIIFSRDENKQYLMDQKFQFHKNYKCLRFFIGDVRDVNRLEMAMRNVDYVIHAAALKHVPIAEYNPFECVRTNVYGAENIVTASIKSGVKKVIALSTDKAANPINLYGATKLASDKIFVSGNNLTGGTTLFSVVRYGNVIGSRGSVILLYKKLIEDKADFLPITDERMTRFWISINQGVNFVTSSLSMMTGGEIFVPKIPSAKVIDIAKVMAPKISQKIIGIRTGEKLHEIMITQDDARNTIELDDRFVIMPYIDNWDSTSFVKLGAKSLNSDFYYDSESNNLWLTQEEIKSLIDNII
tara:strand:+ start:51 stop:1076 length:1026 start_codon:yes stop_codon:yes gene_type:complete